MIRFVIISTNNIIVCSHNNYYVGLDAIPKKNTTLTQKMLVVKRPTLCFKGEI